MDNAIQSTADDAIRAKGAAVQAGYYEDPFVTIVSSTTTSGACSSSPTSPSSSGVTRGGRPPQPQPRMVQPIIKRGTHARVVCMDRALTSFLKLVLSPKNHEIESACSCQIVVLGAGKDTSFFRLKTRILHGLDDDVVRLLQSATTTIRWYDVDHDAVIREKAVLFEREPVFQTNVLRRNESCYECKSKSSSVERENTRYFLISFDLRRDMFQLQDELLKHDFDSNVHTLFVSECCCMYLPESSTLSLLRGIATMASKSYLAMYEPILGDDSFGQVMERNLLGAHVVQRDSCLIQTRSLSQHLSKLATAGFAYATGCDMWAAYDTVLSPEQRQRANKCEFLDELEEWTLIMKHYCLVVASNDDNREGVDGSCDGATYCSVGMASPMGFTEGQCETMHGR